MPMRIYEKRHPRPEVIGHIEDHRIFFYRVAGIDEIAGLKGFEL
jgi:hypothetical protein